MKFNRQEKVFMLTIVFLVALVIWQFAVIANLQHCSKTWHDLYWEEKMKIYWLEGSK